MSFCRARSLRKEWSRQGPARAAAVRAGLSCTPSSSTGMWRKGLFHPSRCPQPAGWDPSGHTEQLGVWEFLLCRCICLSFWLLRENLTLQSSPPQKTSRSCVCACPWTPYPLFQPLQSDTQQCTGALPDTTSIFPQTGFGTLRQNSEAEQETSPSLPASSQPWQQTIPRSGFIGD